MADRTPLIAGNWKMNKSGTEAVQLCAALSAAVANAGAGEVDVIVCPPATALREVSDALMGTGIAVGGQNMHEEAAGAFTGELSGAMLDDAGATSVILGHSERRTLFGETDEALAKKVPAALEAGLTPILCVGESESEREGGQTDDVLRTQVEAGLAGVGDERLPDVVIAYEPIWAIGTGKTATPEMAQESIAFIRGVVAERDAGAAERMRILYGGSMKPGNAAELLALPDLDGGLIGGASLVAEDFGAIVSAAGGS
jgi:triosephosphate isomerase (TIM)